VPESAAPAADLRRITRRPVRVRPAPLRRCWTVSLTTRPVPITEPLVRLLDRRIHALVRHRGDCRFVGRRSAPRMARG
jgi:hypothetical protein